MVISFLFFIGTFISGVDRLLDEEEEGVLGFFIFFSFFYLTGFTFIGVSDSDSLVSTFSIFIIFGFFIST